jgi:hypothetical protein
MSITMCPICLTEETSINLYTSCNHSFCGECMFHYILQGSLLCPLCRTEIEYFYINEKRMNICDYIENIIFIINIFKNNISLEYS